MNELVSTVITNVSEPCQGNHVESASSIQQSSFTCNPIPALIMGAATCATALATRRQVETTPTTGAKGRMAFTSAGAYLLAVIPMAMGARTTYENQATNAI